MFYDYRAARDHIFGVVRSGDKIERIDPNGLTMVERMLLVVLVEFAPHIEPSIASLVKMTGMCERTVRGTLRSLEKKGAIKTTSRHGGRSHYELTVSTSDPGKSCPPPRQQVPPCGNVTQGQELPPAPAADAGLPRQQMPPKQTNKADKKADNISAPPTASRSPALFALEPTEAEQKAEKPSKVKTSAKSESKPKSETVGYSEVLVAYFDAYKARRGQIPLFDGAEGSAVKRLLKKTNGNADIACMVIRNAFADNFWGPKSTILTIAKDPSRFLTITPERAGGRKTAPPQPGTNAHIQYDDDEIYPTKKTGTDDAKGAR